MHTSVGWHVQAVASKAGASAKVFLGSISWMLRYKMRHSLRSLPKCVGLEPAAATDERPFLCHVVFTQHGAPEYRYMFAAFDQVPRCSEPSSSTIKRKPPTETLSSNRLTLLTLLTPLRPVYSSFLCVSPPFLITVSAQGPVYSSSKPSPS